MSLRIFSTLAAIFLLCFSLPAQTPRVPSSLEISGLKLHINEKARKQIQADVDALHRSPSYFDKKLARVQMYFPIIERILNEENVPEEIKYLVIQESALIPDAVSSSNAVGFWQFKVPAAREVGLRVDHIVDERMNIVSSTQGAARYLKKNHLYFKNWIYAIMAYQTGRGGAEKHIKRKYIGANKMDIDQHTYWYVKKFLAHLIAFQSELDKRDLAPLFLMEYEGKKNEKLKNIADSFNVDKELLESYNKGFKKGLVPPDKSYALVIPMDASKAKRIAGRKIRSDHSGINGDQNQRTFAYKAIVDKYDFANARLFPELEKKEGKDTKINRRKGTLADGRSTIDMLALQGDISVEKFMKFNDMTGVEQIQRGKPYYFQRKRNKASTHYHVVLPGETLWGISQKYGVKLKSLMRKNRLEKESDIKTGLLLWMRYIRPADTPPVYHDIPEKILHPKKQIASSELPSQAKSAYSPKEKADEHAISEKSKVDDVEQYTTVEPKKTGFNPSKTIIHTVKSGETLYGISLKYGVEHSEIVEINQLNTSENLAIGTDLKIPQAKTARASHNKEEYIIHIVKPEETLYGIARQYEVSVKDLMEWNNKTDFAIKPLQQLKILKR
ncbi:MAG TPA: hypothetical protein DDY13_20175 [Cytophagales bacterium]|jgi:membrane-bound lytic murein transglycosylase D|nr:hypothetical protein [Cytophagales bacterium]